MLPFTRRGAGPYHRMRNDSRRQDEFDLPPTEWPLLSRFGSWRGPHWGNRWPPPMPFSLFVSDAQTLVNPVPGIRGHGLICPPEGLERFSPAVAGGRCQRLPLFRSVRPLLILAGSR